MSYSFDGKIANQYPKRKTNESGKVLCEKCGKEINPPKLEIPFMNNRAFYVYHYLNTDYYIYEAKGKHSVVYCSEYCKKKHNHRFSR